jgi:hypothetical protein
MMIVVRIAIPFSGIEMPADYPWSIGVSIATLERVLAVACVGCYGVVVSNTRSDAVVACSFRVEYAFY